MLNLDWPVVETGDAQLQLESWRVTGWNDSNTHRGRLYVVVSSDALGGQVDCYKSDALDAANLVARAEGALSTSIVTRIALVAQNSSGLGGSVVLRSAVATTSTVLWLALASQRDLELSEDQVQHFLLQSPVEVDLLAPIQDCMRVFLQRMKRRYRPTQGTGNPFMAVSPAVEPALEGLPEDLSQDLWTSSLDKYDELTGLENPQEYREWARLHTLAILWRRLVRDGPENDPAARMHNFYAAQAESAWSELAEAFVDADRDRLSDRQISTYNPSRTRA